MAMLQGEGKGKQKSKTCTNTALSARRKGVNDEGEMTTRGHVTNNGDTHVTQEIRSFFEVWPSNFDFPKVACLSVASFFRYHFGSEKLAEVKDFAAGSPSSLALVNHTKHEHAIRKN
jgi:hypothetical protein